VATEYVMQRDLDAFKAEMHGEFAGLRGEFAGLRGAFAELRGEVRALGGELRGEIAEVRRELKGLRGEFKEELAGHSRTIIYSNIATMLGFGGILLAAVRFA
jgi:hypothetical protein